MKYHGLACGSQAICVGKVFLGDTMEPKLPERYVQVKALGQGGYGSVFLCQDTKENTLVAVKFCHVDVENSRERFAREAQVMKQIKHPNLVCYREFWSEPLAIVMEYVQGENLRSKIQKEMKIPWEEALNIILQIIDGLKEFHIREMIHRDIKPSNILITLENRVKLVDFGLVKSKSFFTEPLTDPNSMPPCTISYSPPEYLGPWEGCDPRSDIFSLGVTFYEMLTGKHPFAKLDQNGQSRVVLASLLQASYEPLSRYVKDLPEGIEHIVRKMITADLERRYSALSILREDIESLEKKTPVMVDPLLSLEQEYGTEDILWAREEMTQATPSPEIIRHHANIKSCLHLMPSWRKEKAIKILLNYSLRHGKWDEAVQWSKTLRGDEVGHKHLLTVVDRIRKQGGILRDWYFQARERLRQSIWKPENFICQKCKKQGSEAAVHESRLFFLPHGICLDCLRKQKPDQYLGEYALYFMEKDVLGSYFFALSLADNSNCIVHKIPYAIRKLNRAIARDIIERYKRGIRLAYTLSKAPWLISSTNPQPLEDGEFTYFFLPYRASRKLPYYFIANKKSSLFVKAYFLVEILRGLELLATASAFHRQIASQVIDIDFEGNIRIGGFYLAKLCEQNTSEDWVDVTLDRSGITIGNPYYMSPEQFKGLKNTNHQSDLWSFGALAYYIMLEQRLFDVAQEDIVAERKHPLTYLTVKKVLKYVEQKEGKQKEALVELRDGISEMIDGCLQEQQEKRYASATQALIKIDQTIRSSFQKIRG